MTYRAEYLLAPPTKSAFAGPERVVGEFWIYYHLNSAGEVLYIGKTCQPAVRTAQHEQGSQWFGDVTEFVWFGPMDEINATAVERELIAVEEPLNNIRHTSRESKSRRTPQAMLKAEEVTLRRLRKQVAESERLVAWYTRRAAGATA